MPTYKQKKQTLKKLVQQQQSQRILKIQEQGHKFKDTDIFKRSEKHYKHYIHLKTDFSKLVDIQQLQCQEVLGKRVYALKEPEGAYLVKGFSDVREQMQIGYQALNRYIYRPYRTNLDGTNGLYNKQLGQGQGQGELAENLQVEPIQVKNQQGQTLYYFNDKIRMANLGYQYDWPHRSYPSSKVPIPKSITKLTHRAVQLFQNLTKTPLEYQGEAVIVNYYKIRDYMIGHLDDGQIDQKNPIFSFCFGLSCVFLLGYPSREREPVALRLQAGDLMIMSGFSRICYHGVPRVIENSYITPVEELQQLGFQPTLEKQEKQYKCLNTLRQVCKYFESHRLNVNVRQVYPNKGVENEI